MSCLSGGLGRGGKTSSALAAELVQLKVDVLVTGSNPVIAAVKQATATIPVVMAVSRNPVEREFHREPCTAWRKHHGAGQ
jgi:ABC-type uncharacterized transport system substrate-binding protein